MIIIILLSLIVIIITLTIEVKFYERFSSVFYLICLLLLFGLFIFGDTINGALSWYSFKKYKQSTSINVFPEAVRAGASLRNYVNLISNFFTIIIYLTFLAIISLQMTILSIALSILIILISQKLNFLFLN